MAITTDTVIKNSHLISEAGSFRLGYRGDIEGLRAVAILLVIAAHAGVPWLAGGGFVVVDVFFVLSGYLSRACCYRKYERPAAYGCGNFILDG